VVGSPHILKKSEQKKEDKTQVGMDGMDVVDYALLCCVVVVEVEMEVTDAAEV